ncbi:arylamine N-acetyltransferase [Gemmata sp. G18]|uniref:Arylamine N-acetyltransferase n=1 Tax=Gemmata palustris TaxID=2822762 RepID=A0ABS5BQX6_9BACT|nr:arylamine N-acetyltransferase [Gemmata palustris]MBP3956055.1 arylamine N-acetyltransferase [Gemmata palustris]
MNLDAYLSRIGYAGPRTPTLPVLRDIVLAHACSIPFENLDVLLGREIRLEPSAVERKLVAARRGGYCFEQNSLLLGALSALGFAARPLSARVRIKATREDTPPRTHLFLRVEAEGGSWLADVGLGGLTPTTPLRIDQLDTEQPTPHETRRIVREERDPAPRYFHQAKLGEVWADVYEFTLEEMPEIDREVGNWWTSTHKNSKFRQNLLAALARPDGTRVSVLNREFTHRRGTEVLERFEITDPEHLLGVLAERFGLIFPAGTRFGAPGAAWPT